MKPTAVASNSAFIDNGLFEIFGSDLADLNHGLDYSQFTLLSLKESAVQKFGQAETNGMFLRAGRAAFYYWMRQNSEALGWHSVDFRLLPAPLRIKRSLADALSWFEGEHILSGELFSSDQTWQIAVTGLHGENARLDCSTFIGFMQELVCWAGAGKFYPACEVECQSSGAECCLFVINKLPAG